MGIMARKSFLQSYLSDISPRNVAPNTFCHSHQFVENRKKRSETHDFHARKNYSEQGPSYTLRNMYINVHFHQAFVYLHIFFHAGNLISSLFISKQK